MITTLYQTVQTDDGVTIAYKTLGTGPRNLLFTHGWGGSSSGFFWQELLAHLDLTGLRMILVDARGHGESEKATTGFTSERFTQDLIAVADAIADPMRCDELVHRVNSRDEALVATRT